MCKLEDFLKFPENFEDDIRKRLKIFKVELKVVNSCGKIACLDPLEIIVFQKLKINEEWQRFL